MEYQDIEKSMLAKGKKELLKHMDGVRLTQKEAIMAKCFECSNGYIDGKEDCQLPDCPLYAFMPYNPNRQNNILRTKRTKSE